MRPEYRAGVPCWVETLQPDPHEALSFYGSVFGWDAAGIGVTPDGGAYVVARIGSDDVAGIATLPRSGAAEPQWATYVAVADVDAAARRARDAGGRVVVPPLDASPAGRLAIVEDPTGATFGLWQAAARRGAQRVNAPGAWAMSALTTPNVERANAFYGAVFGWRTEPFQLGAADAVLYRLPGYVGGTEQQPVPRDVVAVGMASPDGASHWNVDFWIDGIDAALARVARGGGSVVTGPFDAPPFRRAVVRDPAGAVFSISEKTQRAS